MSDKNLNIEVAVGNNFSGRTDFLKSVCRTDDMAVFIGEIPSNYLSGVSPTVLDELNLFSSRTKAEIKNVIFDLLQGLRFDKLYHNNPFLLSGGEQVILSIVSSILQNPSLIAIDTALEQLSMNWKVPLFQAMINSLVDIRFYLSDNRINDYNIKYITHKPVQQKSDFKYNFLSPNLIPISNGLPSYIINFTNLEFGYTKNQVILQNIELELEPGNLYFLTGNNGAGKSTLAKILAGIMKTRSGKFYVNNNQYNPYKYPGQMFGYCFQNPDEQLFSSNIAEEILAIKKNENKLYYNRRKQFIQMFGLENLTKAHPSELPFVMRKRIALAATFAYERPWYIIDEPTIGQDDNYIDFLVAFINKLLSAGKGIIIITHSNSFISKFRAKILNLDKGQIKTSESK